MIFTVMVPPEEMSMVLVKVILLLITTVLPSTIAAFNSASVDTVTVATRRVIGALSTTCSCVLSALSYVAIAQEKGKKTRTNPNRS